MIARFSRAFPGWYYDPHRWPTSDGVIPYPLFMVMLDTLIAMGAEQQLVMTQSVQHGVMSANNPGDYALQSANNLLIDKAYPLGGGRCRLTTQDPDTLIDNDRAWGKHGNLWVLERE